MSASRPHLPPADVQNWGEGGEEGVGAGSTLPSQGLQGHVSTVTASPWALRRVISTI